MGHREVPHVSIAALRCQQFNGNTYEGNDAPLSMFVPMDQSERSDRRNETGNRDG